MSEIDQIQNDLFGFNPEISGLAFQSFKLADGKIIISATANTEAVDITMLTPERWAEAVSRHLIGNLCGCDLDVAMKHLKAQYLKIQNEIDEKQKESEARKKDAILGFAKQIQESGVVVSIEPSRKSKKAKGDGETPTAEELERAGQRRIE